MPWWNPFRKTRAQPDAGTAAPRPSRAAGLEERMLRDRIVLLGTPINDEVANRVIAQLLFLENESPEEPIHLYLNSPGGSVTAGFAICDTLERLKPIVSTICVGQCSGIAALLVALGTQGYRFTLPHGHFTLTPLTSGSSRPEDAPTMERLSLAFGQRLALATSQSVDRVLRDCEAERRLSATEARDYGLVDARVTKPPA
jgi:ATP-dependent Clp protease protease subunit